MVNLLKDGLPIESKYKIWGVLVGALLLIVNHNIVVINSIFNYPYRDIVSLLILIFIVLISVGSHTAEVLIIGFAIFAIASNLWDFSVIDISEWRKQVLIGSIIILIIALLIGKVSIYNLIDILKRQLGGR